MDQRIPIDDFVDFNRCVIRGYSSGIRWAAAMDAFDQALKQRQAERKANREPAPDWRNVYVVR